LGVKAKAVLAIGDDLLAFLLCQLTQCFVVAIIGEYIFKFYLQRWVLFNERMSVGLKLSGFFVIA
jgi:hypothetical protein